MCHGQVIGAAILKARKAKPCSECGRTIEAGEEYSRWAWAADGTISKVQVHLRCHAMIAEAVSEVGDQCLVGEAQVYLRDAVNHTGTWRDLRARLRRGVDLLLSARRKSKGGV